MARVLTAPACAVLLLVAGCSTSDSSDTGRVGRGSSFYGSDPEELQSKIDELQSEVDDLTAKLDDVESEVANAKSKIMDLEYATSRAVSTATLFGLVDWELAMLTLQGDLSNIQYATDDVSRAVDDIEDAASHW